MALNLRYPLLAGLAALALAPAVRAAESYDNCNNFIDSLPAVISTQGVWCLRKDLSTAQASGNAILVDANNVTIDCNGFKLGGLAGGAGTTATGVALWLRLNGTVRNCTIRGFAHGVVLAGGGHLVEDNRLESNTQVGITVQGDGSMVRRNQVIDTGGGNSAGVTSIGIAADGGVDVLDNTISGAIGSEPGDALVIGIWVNDGSGSVIGNRVRGLVNDGLTEYGIHIGPGSSVMVVGNQLRGPRSGAGSMGIRCADGSVDNRAKDNLIVGFTDGHNCGDAGGNDFLP